MPSFCCYIVLAAVIFSAVVCTPYVSTFQERRLPQEESNIDGKVRELLHSDSEEGFLAEENTPVWISERSDVDKTVNYTKINENIVRMAIEYWKSMKFEGPKHRSYRNTDADTSRDFARELVISSSSSSINAKEETAKFRTVLQRDESLIDFSSAVFHPTILVTTDYNETASSNDSGDTSKSILERILYVLAFWNAVDLQLRHIRNPKVRLRIVGIVIGSNKAAAPYLRDNENSFGFDINATYTSLSTYWRNQARNNPIFSKNFYDIVATMTDSKPENRYSYNIANTASGRNCTNGDFGVMIVSDDRFFGGIQLAVGSIGQTFLKLDSKENEIVEQCDEKDENVLSEYIGSLIRDWTTCGLKRISNGLQNNGRCMYRPNDNQPSGKPIETILPGTLMPASRQCEGFGWKQGFVCSKHMTCKELFCAMDSTRDTCYNFGDALDGTECATGKMIFDESPLGTILADFLQHSIDDSGTP